MNLTIFAIGFCYFFTVGLVIRHFRKRGFTWKMIWEIIQRDDEETWNRNWKKAKENNSFNAP